MNNLIDLTSIKYKLQKEAESTNIDVQASIEILAQCAKMLNLNSLPELQAIKTHINETIKELKSKNEKR